MATDSKSAPDTPRHHRVAAEGYRVRRIPHLLGEHAEPERRLIEPKEASRLWFEFEPSTQPALFLRFADLPARLGDRDVMDWADQYGFLVDGHSQLAHPELPHGWHEFGPCEFVDEWEQEKNLMTAATDLWLALKAGETSALDSLADRLRRGLGLPPDTFLGPMGARDTLAEALRSRTKLGRFVRVAPVKVEGVVRADLAGGFFHGSPPGGLLQAMWHQFADAAVNETNFGRCTVCEQWMAAPTRRRKYCSDACTMAAARSRQRRAMALHGDGVPYEQIAEQVGSNLDTVRRWAAAERARQKRGRANG